MAEGELLRQHILSSISMGSSKKDVEDLLTKAGWPKELIRKYTEKAEGAEFFSLKKRSEKSIIKINGVTKSYDNRLILQDISLDIAEGEVFGIIGMSGVGKTTLLNIIVGFVQPDSGDVIVRLPNGQDVSILKNTNLVKTRFGYSTQIPSVYAKLTVEENLLHFAALYSIPEQKRLTLCRNLLELVDLRQAKDQLAQTLSVGMRKRLDIACALIHDPDVLILDEPTADMDPITRRQMWDLLRQINKRGKTIIIASHFVGDIEAICSRIAIIRNKRITEVGTVEELRGVYSTNYEIELVTEKADYSQISNSIEKNSSLKARCVRKGAMLTVYTPYPDAVLSLIINNMKESKDGVKKLSVAKPSLSEIFEALIKK